MGYYVAVNLSFPSNNSAEGLRALGNAAKDTLNNLNDGYEGRHVRWMCESIVSDPSRYVHGGNKGDMFVWSGVWNYYNFEQEKDALNIFLMNCWQPDLANKPDHIIFDFERALLLINPEQADETHVYEFRLKNVGPEVWLDFVYSPSILDEHILIRKRTITLSWGQM